MRALRLSDNYGADFSFDDAKRSQHNQWRWCWHAYTRDWLLLPNPAYVYRDACQPNQRTARRVLRDRLKRAPASMNCQVSYENATALAYGTNPLLGRTKALTERTATLHPCRTRRASTYDVFHVYEIEIDRLFQTRLGIPGVLHVLRISRIETSSRGLSFERDFTQPTTDIPMLLGNLKLKPSFLRVNFCLGTCHISFIIGGI